MPINLYALVKLLKVQQKNCFKLNFINKKLTEINFLAVDLLYY